MNGNGEQAAAFEIGVVVPKRTAKEEDDCVELLVSELSKVGFLLESVHGLADEFIKLAAPSETLGRAAAELQIRKPTHIGMDLQFEWEEVDAFVRQPDGSLFSWCERFRCYNHLIYGIVNTSKAAVSLRADGRTLYWEVGESLLRMLESEGIVKQVFPLHDDIMRKKLLRGWALNWWDLTKQPIEEIHSYFGLKIAVYFAFLQMYTQWMIFPAALGIFCQLGYFGSLQLLVLPVFFISIILWAVLFFQFWKRKNSALLARWHIRSVGDNQPDTDWNTVQSSKKIVNKKGDNTKDKETFQRAEWFGYFMRCRNDAVVISSIICLQLPFELAYAHLYEVIHSDVMKFGLTAIYLFVIQYFTRIGGRISVKLIKYENNESREYRADSLVYKVLENLLENSLPYLKYSYKKYGVRKKRKNNKESSTWKIPRVEKEYLKPTYSASIGEELEDGLFDDFLELALQFGMIMMFGCAFPLAFAFSTLNNITEIRADALKLLVMLRRPVPHASATIGAWLNIFQFLIVMSICTNSALLVCLYDQEGKWRIEPGLAAILVMEHMLLLIKFGFSRFVPEEPAWVKANRVKNATQAQDMCSKQLLRSISGGERMLGKIVQAN